MQKVTQHLQKKHKMSAATAARKKCQAPWEAVNSKVPNPHTRSSGLQHRGLFVTKMITPHHSPSPSPIPKSTTPPPPPPCTPITSGKFHAGGPFLDHLKTRAGGHRKDHSAGQITRYVGKYLHQLNPVTVAEGELLQTPPIVPYLERLGSGAAGCCTGS